MTKSKKSIAMHGTLLCPLVLGHCAFLRANGFPNARFVVNGFQGSAIKEGPQAGFRTQNGWQNSGLPWSPKMNPEKMYRLDKR